MSPLEIALVIVGIVAFVISFFVPEKAMSQAQEKMSTEQIKKIYEQEAVLAKKMFEDKTEEEAANAVKTVERALEKTSNEKIMAVSEYSDTVLEEIDKAHKEVLFLHSMMCDKEQDVKNMLTSIKQYAKETEQIKKDIADIAADGEALNDMVRQAGQAMEQSKKAILYELDGMEDRARETADCVLQDIGVQMQNKMQEHISKTGQTNEHKDVAQSMNAEQSVAVEHTVTSEQDGITEQKTEVEENLMAELEMLMRQEERSEQKSDLEEKPSLSGFVKKLSKNDEIVALAKKGLTEIEIAKQLGIGRGEVKLVLDLYDSQQASIS